MNEIKVLNIERYTPSRVLFKLEIDGKEIEVIYGHVYKEGIDFSLKRFEKKNEYEIRDWNYYSYERLYVYDTWLIFASYEWGWFYDVKEYPSGAAHPICQLTSVYRTEIVNVRNLVDEKYFEVISYDITTKDVFEKVGGATIFTIGPRYTEKECSEILKLKDNLYFGKQPLILTVDDLIRLYHIIEEEVKKRKLIQ